MNKYDGTVFTHYVIYSPDVPIIRSDKGHLLDKPYTVSIITCPAVNAFRVSAEKRPKIEPVMSERILKVLSVGYTQGHDSLVLGAWGCGAFGNDSRVIARLFHRTLTNNFRGAIKQVVFSVLDWTHQKQTISPFSSLFKKQ